MATYAPFHVTIANVSGSLYEGEATLLTIPSLNGLITILAHHEPLVTLIRNGTIMLTAQNTEEKTFSVESGVVEVHDNNVLILI